MKKQTLIALLLLAALVLTGCGSAPDVSQLEKDIEALQNQVDDLSARLDALEENSGLLDWHLSANSRTDNSGATVTLTASPLAYHEGQSARFIVRLGSQEVAAADCEWNGSVYTGIANLDAADGYSYYCILTAANGAKEHIALNTPENPVDDALVYMETSLTAYCNMIVDAWEDEGGKLSITAGFAQVQLPRIFAGEDQLGFAEARLVLKRNGDVMQTQPLEIPAGEGAGSYELAIGGVSFDMPEMEDDYQLEVSLEVTLTDGQVLTAIGGSWYYNGGEMIMVVG